MRENGDIPSTLELIWLILVHIYALVAFFLDGHPNIVQWTQLLIILSYVGIIEPNSHFSGHSLVLGWVPLVDCTPLVVL